LENAVMVGGTPILGVLAILIYTLSAVSLNRNIAVPPKGHKQALSIATQA